MKNVLFRVGRLMLSGILIGMGPAIAYTASPEQTIDHETHMRYTVRPGDTLWDISQKFYNSPAGWPDIWSLNPHITNPHRLTPGDTVYIIRETRQEIVPETPLPVPVKPEPVMASPPARKPKIFRYPGIDRAGFVRTEPAPSDGKVALMQNDPNVKKDMLGQGDTIYVKSSTEIPLPVGNRYVIYRLLEPVKNPQTGQSAGYPHYIAGLASILETKGDMSLARIDKSFRTIMVDDLLMPYSPKPDEIPVIDAISGISGRILCPEEPNSMFATGEIVFIDKGLNDGIQFGQCYALYEEDDINQTRLSYDYGEILILGAEATTATALITRTDRTIEKSAEFRTPTSAMMLRTDLR